MEGEGGAICAVLPFRLRDATHHPDACGTLNTMRCERAELNLGRT